MVESRESSQVATLTVVSPRAHVTEPRRTTVLERACRAVRTKRARCDTGGVTPQSASFTPKDSLGTATRLRGPHPRYATLPPARSGDEGTLPLFASVWLEGTAIPTQRVSGGVWRGGAQRRLPVCIYRCVCTRRMYGSACGLCDASCARQLAQLPFVGRRARAGSAGEARRGGSGTPTLGPAPRNARGRRFRMARAPRRRLRAAASRASWTLSTPHAPRGPARAAASGMGSPPRGRPLHHWVGYPYVR